MITKKTLIEKLSEEEQIDLIESVLMNFKHTELCFDYDVKEHGFIFDERNLREVLNVNEYDDTFNKMYSFKSLWNFIKKLNINQSYHCSHEHDCCGCLCSYSINSQYSKKLDLVIIVKKYNYNY